MGKRIEWLKLQWRHGQRGRLPYALFFFATYEAYYRLCALLGHRPRHFLDPMPASIAGLKPGDRYLVVWPRLPLPVQLLDKVIAGHVEFSPYTPEAAAGARAKGLRAEVRVVRAGVLRSGGSFK